MTNETLVRKLIEDRYKGRMAESITKILTLIEYMQSETKRVTNEDVMLSSLGAGYLKLCDDILNTIRCEDRKGE